ncbi:unnamed protein product [Dicrocoelium dendriticum]|nr:unnamed protein product [Dicrocoelium dendriticum]
MHLLTILVATLLALYVNGCFNTIGNNGNERKEFEEFKEKFGKMYSPEEEEQRFKNFVANLQRVKALQEESSSTTEFGVTKFFDLTPEEFAARYTNLKPQNVRNEHEEPEEGFHETERLYSKTLQGKAY